MTTELTRICATDPGGPEKLQPIRVPMPEPTGDQVLIQIEAAGVNYIDVYHRTGQYPMPSPIPMGLEGAGRIIKAGPDAKIATGTRVAWAHVPGSYATHVLARAAQVVTVPEGIDSKTAAAAMLQGFTTHYLTRSTFALGKDHTCLVHAAAGGVGLLLCQVGKRVGARVIGTVSTPAKAELARAAGAAHTILYTQTDFVAEVKKITENRGVDVVYDSVGKTTFDGSMDCLRPRGVLALFGQSSGAVPPVDPQRLSKAGSVFLTRPSLQHHIATRDELETRAKDLFSWIREDAVKIAIDSTYPLLKAADAHRRLESRASSGKIVLEIA